MKVFVRFLNFSTEYTTVFLTHICVVLLPTALEALVEHRITGFPVIDDDWKLVTPPCLFVWFFSLVINNVDSLFYFLVFKWKITINIWFLDSKFFLKLFAILSEGKSRYQIMNHPNWLRVPQSESHVQSFLLRQTIHTNVFCLSFLSPS